MGGIDLYQVAAEARSDGALMDQGTISTNVTGMADVDFDITEPLRVVDVGEEIIYRINVKNLGSKDATRLQISAELSENLEPIEYSGVEESQEGELRPGQSQARPARDRTPGIRQGDAPRHQGQGDQDRPGDLPRRADPCRPGDQARRHGRHQGHRLPDPLRASPTGPILTR